MDNWSLRIILVALGLLLLIGTAGTIYLDSVGRPIPPTLSALVGTALGALTGYLMPYGKNTQGPTDGSNRRA